MEEIHERPGVMGAGDLPLLAEGALFSLVQVLLTRTSILKITRSSIRIEAGFVNFASCLIAVLSPLDQGISFLMTNGLSSPARPCPRVA